MTKKLEELFNVEVNEEMPLTKDEGEKQEKVISAKDIPDLQTAMENVDKIDAALPSVRELDSSDKEMDDIADLAKDTFKDLMDLGMNVEARFSGEIFNNASRMLDTAINAKQHKVNKKLRMVDLQIKKATLDAKLAKQAYERGDDIEDGQGHAIDRTQLLQEILGRNTHEKE